MARKRAAASKDKEAKKQKVESEEKLEKTEEQLEKTELKIEKTEEKPKEKAGETIDETERTPEKIKTSENASELKSDTFNIVSWNVAGLYAAVKKDLCKSVIEMNPDVICLQETKTSLKKQPPPEIAEKLKETIIK